MTTDTINIDGPSVFERNVAAYYGGGVYTRRTPLILTGNNIFNANSAKEGGGIFAIANSTLSFGGLSTFRANRAHVSGGGIWLDQQQPNIEWIQSTLWGVLQAMREEQSIHMLPQLV